MLAKNRKRVEKIKRKKNAKCDSANNLPLDRNKSTMTKG